MSFRKLFSGGHLFVVVECLCKRSPKIKTKNIKNYSLVSAIVNHRNRLDDSPPLNAKKVGCCSELEKTACQHTESDLVEDLVVLSARTRKT